MEDDYLLDSAEEILDNIESEDVSDENDIIDIEEDSNFLQESSESSDIGNQLVISQELVDSFQEFLETREDSDGLEEQSSSDLKEDEQVLVDYTDILEDIYSQNVNSNLTLYSLQENLESDFLKPFEDYSLAESFMFLTFVTVFVMFVFKTFVRSF